MKKKKKDDLPDYTVANMDVEGMPWNSKKSWQIFPGPNSNRGLNQRPRDNTYSNLPPMTKEERRSAIWLCLKAALAVAFVFGAALFLFVLFCVYVWLR